MCFVRSLKQQGAEEAHRALPNEALYGNLRMLGLIIPAYLHTAWQPGQAKNLASRVSSHCSVLINLQVTWVKSLSTSRSSPESMSGGVNLYSVCVCVRARANLFLSFHGRKETTPAANREPAPKEASRAHQAKGAVLAH